MLRKFTLLYSLCLIFGSVRFCFAQQPKLMLPIGHTKDISSARFSPDGKRIVTASSDETVKIWDVASGYLLLTLKGDSTGVTSAQYTRDGKKIMTLDWGLTIKIMDAETGKILHKINRSTDEWNTDQIKDAQISPDGSRILGLTTNHKAGIWDVSKGELLFYLQEGINRKGDRFGFIQYSPDGKKILTLSLDSTVKIWDAESGKPVFEIPQKDDRLQSGSARYSPDGKKIITVYPDNSVRMWDAETGQLLPEANVIKENFSYLEYSPDGKNMLTRLWNDTVKIWDGSTGRLLFYLQEGENKILESNYSPDGKNILTRLENNIIKIWDAATGKLLSVPRGHTPNIHDVQYSPDGKRIIWSGFSDYNKPASGWVWDEGPGKLSPPVKADSASFNNVFYSPDMKKVVTTSSLPGDYPGLEQVKLWDLVSGKRIKTLTGEDFYKVKIIFSPDGKKLVAFSESLGSPTIWDANTGNRLGELPYTYSRIVSVQFSKDGKKILARSLNGSLQSFLTNELKVWNIDTRKILKEWNQFGDGLEDAQISPDGKKMFIAFDSTIRIWDFTTLKPLFDLKHPGYVISIAYSPDGKKIVTNNLDSTINLWDANTGKLLTVSSGNTEITYSMQFSPDSKKIVTASGYEKVAKIWDAENGNFLAELRGHGGSVDHAVFNPDGKSIITTSADNTLKKWDAATGKCLYTFFAVDKDDYLVVDNDNHYDGTEAARKLLYFVCGTEIVDLAQVKDQLWVPGLAERINNNETINAKSLNDLNICGLTPLVEEINDNQDEYHFTIKPRRGGLGSFTISINGAIADTRLPEQLTKKDSVYELRIVKSEFIPYLPDGQINKISLKAYTADNAVSSREINITIDKTAKPAPPPNLYGVMIGISDYKGDKMDLGFAAIDATDISNAVADAAGKLLGREHVFMYNLTTAKEHYRLPEKKSIKEVFEEIGKKATANDILFIFFSGHGVMEGEEKKQFYCMTVDASDFDQYAEAGISTAELTEWIKPQNIKAQKRILILDACHSGQAINDFVKLGNEGQGFLASKGDDKAQQVKAIDKLNERSGLFILSASAGDKLSFESQSLSHGYLSYSLLKTIKEQPDILEEGNLLNIGRWFNAAENTVDKVSKEEGVSQQTQIVTTTSFNIGIVDDEVTGKIKLPQGKQLFSASNFQNSDVIISDDDLDLGKMINAGLADVSSKGTEGEIMFIPSANSPETFRLSGRYAVKGNVVTVTVNIRQNKVLKSKFVLTGTKDKLDELALNIVKKASEWVGTIKKP